MDKSKKVHEGWAQLITYWVAEAINGEFKEHFEKLNEKQSDPYKVYINYTGEIKKKMLDSLEKLRELTCPATVDAWDEILKNLQYV